MGKLSKEEELVLLSWIESFEISRPSRRLSRDFADAVPLAEILKSLFPKWIDLHNYPVRNAIHLKLDNWATLNRKVLHKLNISLDYPLMHKLSEADHEAIKEVLYDVMKKSKAAIEARASKRITSEISNMSGDIMTINVERRTGDKVETVQQQMILYSMYQHLEHTLNEKNQIILILSKKNEHLENMINLKEQRIEDLQKQLDKIKKTPKDWLSLD